MWTINGIDIVFGDCPQGYREATAEEVAAYEVARAKALIPKSVTIRQARLQLLAINKLTDVETAIASMGQAAQITWEFSSVVERNNPLCALMQTLLGYTDAEMDNLFVEASKL